MSKFKRYTIDCVNTRTGEDFSISNVTCTDIIHHLIPFISEQIMNLYFADDTLNLDIIVELKN